MYTCIGCSDVIDVLLNNSEENATITCIKCGVINYVDTEVKHSRRLNITLIKDKIQEVLNDKQFELMSDELKEEIISKSSYVYTNSKNTILCFCLMYAEFKNKMNFTSDVVIKKKQRKNIIRILIDIVKPDVMKFVRTPKTYIDTSELTESEKEIYNDISDCLMFLNASNKKNLQQLYQKIYSVILLIRHNKPIIISASCNLTDIIKYIAVNRVKVTDLLQLESNLFENKIITLF